MEVVGRQTRADDHDAVGVFVGASAHSSRLPSPSPSPPFLPTRHPEQFCPPPAAPQGTFAYASSIAFDPFCPRLEWQLWRAIYVSEVIEGLGIANCRDTSTCDMSGQIRLISQVQRKFL